MQCLYPDFYCNLGILTPLGLVGGDMEETEVGGLIIRWKRVLIGLAIFVPIILTVIVLTFPIVGCIDYYSDGHHVTHYGKQCLEQPADAVMGLVT